MSEQAGDGRAPHELRAGDRLYCTCCFARLVAVRTEKQLEAQVPY
jgi:hypothetical protein